VTVETVMVMVEMAVMEEEMVEVRTKVVEGDSQNMNSATIMMKKMCVTLMNLLLSSHKTKRDVYCDWQKLQLMDEGYDKPQLQ